MSRDDLRSMAPGQTVSIFGCRASGQPYLEGQATIEASGDRPHFYRVRFHGERVTRLRFVNPDWQQDPAHSLALLIQFWRATASPSFDEFFPDIP